LSARKRLRRNRIRKAQSCRWTTVARRIRIGLKLSLALVFIMVMSSTLILGYDLLTQHDSLRIETISVEGEHRLPEDAIIDQSRVTRGLNILSVNLSTIRKRLLAHPAIAEAGVKRELPSRIRLSIREHEPLAVLDLGRKFVINAKGDIYREMRSYHLARLPMVSGLEFSDINDPGQPFTGPLGAVMEVLRLGQIAESVVPNRTIERIHVDRQNGLTLYARDHVKEIRLGYGGFDSKYDRLKNVLYHLKVKPGFGDLESIDLNNLNRIVVNPSRREPPAGWQKEA
jgi:cell division protein FtsQ